MRYVGLLDCNNFFVSCERLFRPDLRTRPTVVLSSNDGCAVARSQEVKDMGIPMGVAYFHVKDTLEKERAAVFSSNFKLYRDISRRVFNVMRELVPVVEQYSVDEAFFLCEADSKEAAYAQISELKREIERQVGIPVSIGLASTKTRAKIASKQAKKTNGVALVDNEWFDSLASIIPVGDVWGIGPRLARRFESYEIRTVADLCLADAAQIARLFGINGVRLQQELKGQAVYTVHTVRSVQQSIMSTRSFRDSTTDITVLSDAVAYHVRSVVEDLRDMELKATSLRVMIRPSKHGDYVLRGGTKEAVLTVPSSDTRVFLREAERLLADLYERGVPYKKAGVVLAGFTPMTATMTSLFQETQARDEDELMRTIDVLNRRFGNDRVQIGGRLRRTAWATRTDRLSPAYTTRWSDIPSVTA